MEKIQRNLGDFGFVMQSYDNDPIQFFSLPNCIANENERYVGFVVDGNGMINEGIKTGDIIVIELSNRVEENDIGCFQLPDGKVVCKKYHYDHDGRNHVLQFCDGLSSPIIVSAKEKKFNTIGKLAIKICKV